MSSDLCGNIKVAFLNMLLDENASNNFMEKKPNSGTSRNVAHSCSKHKQYFRNGSFYFHAIHRTIAIPLLYLF